MALELKGRAAAAVPTPPADYATLFKKTGSDLLAIKNADGSVTSLVPLPESGKIDAGYLPSYVDDVMEYANLAALPVTGEAGKIYVALDTGRIYRWSGSVYAEIVASPGTTDAITEGATNLFFTLPRVRSTVLTGIDLVTSTAVSAADTVLSAIGKLWARVVAHIADVANPHGTTKAQVGLGNVDNTSDATKPVSTTQQTALNLKSNLASPAFTGTVTGITKAMVGLGNADDTSDATKNAAAVILTNKTLTSPVINAINATPIGTVTPAAGSFTTLAASGAITGVNLSGTNTGDQDLSAMVTLAGAQTLVNKTLTSPVINGFSGTGNGAVTGNLAITGALSATGASTIATFSPTVATAPVVVKFNNAGTGDFFIGKDGSAGDAFGAGSTAYTAHIYNGANTPIEFWTNAVRRMKLDSTGLAVTGALSATGSLTTSYGTGTAPAIVIGDTQYGIYAAGGNTRIKSANSVVLDNQLIVASGGANINGEVAVAGTLSSTGLLSATNTTNWYGAHIGGYGGTDRTVIGNLSNRATYGAHNGALNAWAPVAVSGSTVELQINEGVVATVSSTGLAVTGALSAFSGAAVAGGVGATHQLHSDNSGGNHALEIRQGRFDKDNLVLSTNQVTSGSFLKIVENGTIKGNWSSTGLAVTGTLSATGGFTAQALDSTGTAALYSPTGGVGVYGFSNNAYAVIQAYLNSVGAGKALALNSAGGNVLINTTTDDGVNRLQVNGPAKVTGALSATGALTTAGLKEDASGNLGLGVTPSDWSSLAGLKAMQVSNGSLSANLASVFVGNNSYFTGTYQNTYISTAPAQQIALNRTGGNDIQFLTAPSGTAGNPITFTQAMTLDASGRLAVGGLVGSRAPRISVQADTASGIDIQSTTTSITITAAATTLVPTDGNYLFICRDSTSGGMSVGVYDNSAGVTMITSGIANVTFASSVGVGLRAYTTGGSASRLISTMVLGVNA